MKAELSKPTKPTKPTKHAEAQKRRVQLKNVKYAAFASQETSCFEAKVYIDGKCEGTVENDGRGGCNFYSTVTLQEKLEHIAATQPECELEQGLGSIKCDPDILIGDLLDEWLEQRDIKRLCAKKTLFRIKSESYKQGEWRTVKAKFSPEVKTWLVNKYGDDLGQILNEVK